MDIHELNNLSQGKAPSSQKIDKKDKRFKQIFEQKLAGVHATTSQIPFDCKKDVLDQSDKILHLLDDYARELIDPTRSLKDIEPLVKSIKKEVSLIENEAAMKIKNDNELERIIKDLAITANVALSKYHRGDYI